MAEGVNSVVIVGNLTRDPELRSTGGGTAVCSLRVAVNGRQKQGEEWVDKPNYFTVNVWDRQAENCAQYLEKGRGVAVQGRLDWREWQDKDGNKRESVEVRAFTVQFLGGGGDRPADQGFQSDVPADMTDLQPASAATGGDDIPF